MFFGCLRIPNNQVTHHFCILGATGSGKTMTFRMLMESVLPQIQPGSDSRALIYDPKRDMMSILAGMGISCPIKTLNPFDARSFAWDIAKDITEVAQAQEVARIFIPQEFDSQPYFTNAARDLLIGVLCSYLLTTGCDWTFRDVIAATQDLEVLKKVLDRHHHTKVLIKRFLENEHTSGNVLSTLSTKTSYLEPIANLWYHAHNKISLAEWVADESILILGTDPTIEEPMRVINQTLFQRIAELLLGQPNSESRRTWIFFDEIPRAGKLNGLNNLLTEGRSKGACVVLGLQDLDSLRDKQLYGPEITNVIAGQCPCILAVGRAYH